MPTVSNTKRRKAVGADHQGQNQFRRDWPELPDDVTASILSRLTPIDVFCAQRVCGVWRRICNRLLTWTKIDLCNDLNEKFNTNRRCLRYLTKPGAELVVRQIVGRSSGNLVDINLTSGFVVVTDDLLRYIVHSSKRIRRLVLEYGRKGGITEAGLTSVAPRLGMLEDLEITLESEKMSRETLEVIGRSCPRLKSFKLSSRLAGILWNRSWNDPTRNAFAQAIARTMRGLQHLTLDRDQLNNEGLKEILDCCFHLETLEMTSCFNVEYNQDLKRRCERIKHFKR